MSSIFLAKGLDSLGWNFEGLCGIQATDLKVDDASYLSLDMRTLGENLAQLGIAQRFFLDEEILQMGLSSSEKQILNSLDQKVFPTEVIHGTSIEEAGVSNMAPDMFLEGSTVNVTEQVGSIQTDSFSEVDALFSTGCEQASLSSPSSAEHPQINSNFENNTAQKSKRSIKILPINTFAAKAAEAELDALLDGAEKQNSSSLFNDGTTGSVLASSSRESLISSSPQALLSPFTQDPDKSTTKALADADLPLVQEYLIPSLSQPFPSPLKQDFDKSNTKVAADAAIPLQSIIPSASSTLPTFPNAKATEGEVGSALFGSSEEDFDVWLDSI
ncbi:hypothetical protein O6H91_06G019000 [Diphasiastrum complanatum]|nr:hypothetical protein O6H91_06G019000 [Diphasiastrum complanatum]